MNPAYSLITHRAFIVKYYSILVSNLKAFLSSGIIDGGHSSTRWIFNCYLMLPDAFILLFVVTGTRFPLVPLVVLVAEPFTTI